MPRSIAVLCAGASQGLLTRLADPLREHLDVVLQGRFGAVGAMKEAFIAGEPCDLMILTDAMIRDMVAEGSLQASGMTALGSVFTGIAVPVGRQAPDISTPESLAKSLRAADSLWVPDTERSTAGIHVKKVLQALGLESEMASRMKVFPNGATAMREMAAAKLPGALGCTQLSEILFTPGVHAVGRLPKQFELGTVYSAAVSSRASEPALARAVIEMLGADRWASVRQDCGFE